MNRLIKALVLINSLNLTKLNVFSQTWKRKACLQYDNKIT